MKKLRKSLIVGIVALFIGLEIVPIVNPTDIIGQHGTVKEELVTREISTNNPRTYYNVSILVISRYGSIDIDGFHESHFGFGHDEKITLSKAGLYTPGIFAIWDSSGLKEICLGGGWMNTIVEIFDYDGWMSFQNIHYPVMFGHCEKIKLTSYRGC
jgi:hypothetical protein